MPQLEKKMEDAMETGIMLGSIGNAVTPKP